ncbi:MAG TPA: hypothetical protein VIH45_05770 [Desulfuromonadaceae bacterium]
MVREILLLAAVLAVAFTAGCTLYHKELDTNPAYSDHQFRYYDLEIAWRAEQTDGTLRLTGTVNNLRSDYLWDMELTSRLVGRDGKVFARQTYADFPTYLAPGKPESFRMEFRLVPGTQPERIHFTYNYWPVEAAPRFRGNVGDTPVFGSFDAPP